MGRAGGRLRRSPPAFSQSNFRTFRGKALRVYHFCGSCIATRQNNLDIGSERARPVSEIPSAPPELAACRGDAAPHKGALVPIYRCYFLDGADHIVMAEMVTCKDDGMAEQRAQELLGRPDPRGGRGHSAVEMWLGPRCVYRTPAPSFH
jgi:hypothetical protein